jgi:pyrroline-5-carboxylate reductase
VDLSPADWRSVLPGLRLAISDRNVVVLAGHGISMSAALKQLHERKLIRCVVTPHGNPAEAILAYHPARWVRAEDADRFRALFPHLAQVLELRDEAQFDVVRALSGIAPAVMYTMADAFADGALMMGLPRAQALAYLAGVLLGASRAMTGGEHPAVLRDSALEAEPAAAGLMELESSGMRGLMMRVVDQAVRQVRRADETELPPPVE